MKTLHIIDHLGLGGAQTMLLNSTYTILSLRIANSESHQLHKNITVLSTRSPTSILSFFKAIQFIWKNQYTIIHTHLTKAFLVGLMYKILFHKIVLIHHQHTHNSTVQTILLKLCSRYCDKIIVSTHSYKNEILTLIKHPQKVSVVENFIAENYIEEDVTSKPYQMVKVIGFAGRIIKRKGWLEFVTAMAMLSDLGYKALIAGSGKEEDHLLQKIVHCPYITYLGEVSDMKRFYQCIDCLVMPSHYEPMGLVQLEAQAMGVPVIATDIDSLNETLTDHKNAILVPVESPTAIVQAVIEFTENVALRNRLVMNGKRNAQQYNYRTWNNKISSLYNGLL